MSKREQELEIALKMLYGWAQEANRRLDYELVELDRVQVQFGGNPYLNPIFKLVKDTLEKPSETEEKKWDYLALDEDDDMRRSEFL